MSFELSIVIILHHMLLAISIGNVKIAVGSDGGFGRYELFLFLVQSCLSRVVDGHQHLAIGRGFENMMAGGFGNEKEILTTFPCHGTAMRPGKFMSPAHFQLSILF